MYDLKKIRPGTNRVLINLVPMNDKVKLTDGTILELDTTFEPSDHVSVCGSVIAVPEKLLFNKKDPDTMFWKTEMELRVGDTVYFDYHVAMMALGRAADHSVQYASETYFVQDGQTYIFIPYQDIFCVVRETDGKKEVIPVNGYVLVKPVLKEYEELDGIEKVFVPYHLRLAQVQNTGVVLFKGKGNTDFLSDKVCDVDGFEVGDTIVYKQNKIRKLEYDLHATLPKGIVTVQRSDIYAVIKNKDNGDA